MLKLIYEVHLLNNVILESQNRKICSYLTKFSAANPALVVQIQISTLKMVLD